MEYAATIDPKSKPTDVRKLGAASLLTAGVHSVALHLNTVLHAALWDLCFLQSPCLCPAAAISTAHHDCCDTCTQATPVTRRQMARRGRRGVTSQWRSAWRTPSSRASTNLLCGCVPQGRSRAMSSCYCHLESVTSGCMTLYQSRLAPGTPTAAPALLDSRAGLTTKASQQSMSCDSVPCVLTQHS
jgi:hypothetical protein